jgi:alkaline phosphatase D
MISRTLLVAALLVGVGLLPGCGDNSSSRQTESLEPASPGPEPVFIDLSLQLPDDVVLDAINWTISGNDIEPMRGTVVADEIDWTMSRADIGPTTGPIDPNTLGADALIEVLELSRGDDYLAEFQVVDEFGQVSCEGNAEFDVGVGSSTEVMVMLNCTPPTELGDVLENGGRNVCAQIAKLGISPVRGFIGDEIRLSALGEDVEGDEISYSWTSIGGRLLDPAAPRTTFTCEEAGEHAVTIAASDGDELCTGDWTVSVTCIRGGVAECPNSPDFPNGVAAGDVDQSSVVLWARANFAGTVRFEWGRDPSFVEIDDHTDVPVRIDDGDGDYIPTKAVVEGLSAGTQYYYRACRGSCPVDLSAECEARGGFRTAHASGFHGLRFGVSSCFDSRSGTSPLTGDLDRRPFHSISNVRNRRLDLFVGLGDNVYADRETELHEYRQAYAKSLSAKDEPSDNFLAQARAAAAFFATIDDHEVENDFAGGEKLDDGNFFNESETFENGIQAFVDYFPVRDDLTYGSNEEERTRNRTRLYRYREFGKDAALLLLDQRSFRDKPESGPVDRWAPGRTMLGKKQLADLKADLKRADQRGITWKFILVPEPIQNVGPAIVQTDGWPGYPEERGEILQFIEDEGIGRAVFISGDIHASIANNLVYKEKITQHQRYSSSWDMSAGPGGHVPTLAFGAVAPGFDSLSPFAQDAAIFGFLDDELSQSGLPLVGLGPEIIGPPFSPFQHYNKQEPWGAELLRGSYVAAYHFSWTEFDIHATTQELTVTTWGIRNKHDSTQMATKPEIVGRFVVPPGRPNGSLCARDVQCASDLCNGKICTAPQKNGSACVRSDGCQSGLCDLGICTVPHSRPALRPCFSGEVCRSESCSLGICTQICGDGFCDGTEKCGGNDVTALQCRSDCGRCPNSSACGDDNMCSSGLCNAGVCTSPLNNGSVCVRDEGCQSGLCNSGICTAPLNNGSACVRSDGCRSGLCDLGICTAIHSRPALSPCFSGDACRSESCSLGTCTQICGDGFCDGTEKCGGNDVTALQCRSDCGRCPNSSACGDDNMCSSGLCNVGVCTSPLNNGSVCVRDEGCQSGLCNAGICTAPQNNGSVCVRNDGCRSGLCDLGICTAIHSKGRFSPCFSDRACRSGNCTPALICGL